MHPAPSTFETAEDGEAWLAAERRLITAAPEDWLPPKLRRAQRQATRLTLGQYAETWLAGRDLKPRTREHYRDLLDRYVLPMLGPLPIRGVTPTLVREWHATLPASRPTMRAHAYSLLRAIMATAVAEELLAANPCRVRGAGSSRRVRRIRPASLEELAVIAEHMPDDLRTGVLLAAWCGLRFGELTELRRGDVELAYDDEGEPVSGVLRVRRAVVRVGGEIVVGTPKSDAGVRDVAIPPHLLPAVVDHLAKHVGQGKTALLFSAAGGGHLAPSSMYHWWRPARESAGRPDLRFHDLRHTGAVLAAATGATLAELMGRLGHSTPAAAMKYQHVAGGRDAQIAAALSRLAGTTTSAASS